MRETLFLNYNRFVNEWHLSDSRGNHISTFIARADAEHFAQESGYRLRVTIGDKIEWFNPKATV